MRQRVQAFVYTRQSGEPGQNAFMSTVSLYAAVIAAASAIIGAAIPQVTSAIRESSQAKRDRRERSAQVRREACMELLRAVGDLRAWVAALYDHHGADMDVRLVDVRQKAANTGLCAASVTLLPPGSLADDANAVAAAVTALVTVAEADPGLKLGAMTGRPDFRSLDESVSAFRKKAEAEAKS
jgi:hypothetical protein